jgi:hypothetical protein
MHEPCHQRGVVMNWDKVWDVLVNKIHVLIAVFYSGGLAGYAMHYGKDIPTGVQNLTYALFAFLAGHNLTNQKYPDPPAQ